MSEKYVTGTAQTRREESNSVKEKLYPYYERRWDVKHIADVEEDRKELSDTTTRSATQLLEVADIDTIVDTYEKQIAIQEKCIFSETGRSLSIRIDNGTDTIASEGDRLLQSYIDGTILTPTVICVAKVTESVEWLRLIKTDRFVEAWKDRMVTPSVYDGDNVNTKLFFDMDEIEDTGACIGAWGEL